MAPTQDNSVFVVKTIQLKSKCAHSRLAYSFDGLKYTSPFCRDGDGGDNKALSILESSSGEEFKNEIQVCVRIFIILTLFFLFYILYRKRSRKKFPSKIGATQTVRSEFLLLKNKQFKNVRLSSL